MENFKVRQLWCLSNTLVNVRQGTQQKMFYVQSRNMHENKGNIDEMPELKRTFMDKSRTFTAVRHEFCRQKRLCDGNLEA